MKRLFFMSVLIASVFTFKTADAQVKLNVNVNIGTQPLWGPVGYRYVEYYYLPDINAYYHVNSKKYTYYNGKKWLTVGNLPKKYRHYNLYNGYKVVVNKERPWVNHNYYASHYDKYKGYKGQPNLKDYGRDEREKHSDYKKYKGSSNHRHYSSRGR